MGVLGNKVGMLTYFTDDGLAVPCTVIGFHEGNIVTQVKSVDTDGYSSVQVGYRRVRDGKLSKPEEGHTKKVGAPPLRHLQEWRVAGDVAQSFAPGQQLNLEELFKEGDIIDVSGTSIGKGFAGQCVFLAWLLHRLLRPLHVRSFIHQLQCWLRVLAILGQGFVNHLF